MKICLWVFFPLSPVCSSGSLTVLLDIHPNVALVIALIPPVIYLILSFKIKADTQLTIAAVLSILYAFLMMISALVIIGMWRTNSTKLLHTGESSASESLFFFFSGNMVEQQTIMTPSSLFIIALACFYIVTALLHPQEVGLIVYGLLYILCIPSAYLLLAIYSMVNMNNVSWGTRETAAPAGQQAGAPQTTAQKGSRNGKTLLGITFGASFRKRSLTTVFSCCKHTVFRNYFNFPACWRIPKETRPGHSVCRRYSVLCVKFVSSFAAKNACTRFFMRSKCCRKLCRKDDTEQLIANQETQVIKVEEPQPQNTIVEDVNDFPK